MHALEPGDNQTLADPGEIPTMMGDSDLGIVMRFAQLAAKSGVFVEFGPWLGGASVRLAQINKLHVVDRFKWTSANAQRVPDLMEVGESFRPNFEVNAAAHKADISVHETDVDDFAWTEGNISFCLLDIPRTAQDLLTCLKSIAGSLTKDAYVLIKHGVGPDYAAMAALLEILISRSIFQPVQTLQPRWCNIAVLRTGDHIQDLSQFDLDNNETAPLDGSVRDMWGESFFGLARLAQHVVDDQFDLAYDQLDRLPPMISSIYRWDELGSFLSEHFEDQQKLNDFSSALAFHCEPASGLDVPIEFHRSPTLARRNYWRAQRDLPWNSRRIGITVFEDAFEARKFDVPSRYAKSITGKNIVEIGPRLGTNWVGFLAAGARSYLGVDTAGHGISAHSAGPLSIRKSLKVALAELCPDLGLIQKGRGSMVFDACFVQADDASAIECETLLKPELRRISRKIEFFEILTDDD